MESTLLGHNCFRLRGRDVTLITDPFAPPEGSLRVAADIVTISHGDEGHNGIKAVEGTPRVVTGPGEYEIKGVLIAGVGHVSRRPGGETARTQHRLFDRDWTTCASAIWATSGMFCPRSRSKRSATVDVLFVPAGGRSVISAAQAAEVISQLEPAVVVPMDWTDARDGQPTGALEQVLPRDGHQRDRAAAAADRE